MRTIQKIDNAQVKKLKSNKKQNMMLGAWTGLQLEDALSKRYWQDEEWRVNMRQYEAIPDVSGRKRPYSESVIIEIPVGARQCDIIVSAMDELIFSASPVFTVRGSPGYEDNAYAFQLLCDKLVIDTFTNFKPAFREVIADDVQMGTGLATTTRDIAVVKQRNFTQTDEGPRVMSIPPEDFVVPGGAYMDLDSMQLIGYRTFYNEAELIEQAQMNGWDITMFKPTGNVSWVRQRREHVAKTDESTDNMGCMYEVFVVYAYYDYDMDGVAESLCYIYDRTSRAIGKVTYTPYDNRPISVARYQMRPHIFWGLGVLQMARPFGMEVSEWHNFKMANAHLSNSRFWAYKLGSVGIGEELEIGPNKCVGFANPKDDLEAKVMADVYPTAQQYEATTLQLADQRVGVNELGGGPIQAGKRVPASTAMSIMQAQNKRFASPFNNVREAGADIMRQAVLRMREQYLWGGDHRRNVVNFLMKTVGPKNVAKITSVFEADSADIRDYVTIEVTASSASINREADRQSALALMQVLGGYYDKILQLAQVLYNPQIPPEMKKLASDIMKASALAVERLLRTFDNVRDPKLFIPDMVVNLQEGGSGDQQEPSPDGTPGNTAGPQAAVPDALGPYESNGAVSLPANDVGGVPPSEGQLDGSTPDE